MRGLWGTEPKTVSGTCLRREIISERSCRGKNEQFTFS